VKGLAYCPRGVYVTNAICHDVQTGDRYLLQHMASTAQQLLLDQATEIVLMAAPSLTAASDTLHLYLPVCSAEVPATATAGASLELANASLIRVTW